MAFNIFKKVALYICAFAALIAGASADAPTTEEVSETFANTYTRIAIVLDLPDDGRVVFEDTTENLWDISDNKQCLSVGDSVVLVMSSNDSKLIYDDVIVCVVPGTDTLGLPIAYVEYEDFENLHTLEK